MSTLIPEIVVQVIATVSGVIISIGVPLILAKINKIGKVYTTLFGVEEVESMSGLVGVVETHDDEIHSLKEGQQEIKDRQADIQTRIARLQESANQRTKDND